MGRYLVIDRRSPLSAGKSLDFDPSLYVAGGVAVWDVEAEDWAWLVHLDLTTDKTK